MFLNPKLYGFRVECLTFEGCRDLDSRCPDAVGLRTVQACINQEELEQSERQVHKTVQSRTMRRMPTLSRNRERSNIDFASRRNSLPRVPNTLISSPLTVSSLKRTVICPSLSS